MCLEALQHVVVNDDLVCGDVPVPGPVHPVEVLVHCVEARFVLPVMRSGNLVRQVRVYNCLRCWHDPSRPGNHADLVGTYCTCNAAMCTSINIKRSCMHDPHRLYRCIFFKPSITSSVLKTEKIPVMLTNAQMLHVR